MRLEIRQLCKRFGAFTALQSVDLDINQGEFFALLGPSGSGKTTLLRIIAGLEVPDEGAIRFAGEDVLTRDPRERQVGFVFQHYALFRHMTVMENVAFGLRVKPKADRPPRAEITRRVEELLHLVQLEGLAQRYPTQLSGGQRQRVALARALAIEPRVLLLDEPFGALDAKVRKELRRWLRELHHRLGLTSVFVTHDQEEALELADRVVVLRQGVIEQVDTPRNVYDRPATPFVYDFLGSANRFTCRIADGQVELRGERLPLPRRTSLADGPATLYVRPHDLEPQADQGQPGVRATLATVVHAGPLLRLELKCDPDGGGTGEQLVLVELANGDESGHAWVPGQRLHLHPRKFGVFREQ